MLFTPKKYRKDWTRFLALSFGAGSLGFMLFAVLAPWMNYGDSLMTIIAAVGFMLAAIVFGALARDQWKKASRMSGER